MQLCKRLERPQPAVR